MSKIAEKKALEVYPMVNPPYSNSDEPKLNVENLYKREGYINGYNQAMKDFLEKAVKWLEIHMPLGKVSHESVYDCIQGFKNYMQDESEN